MKGSLRLYFSDEEKAQLVAIGKQLEKTGAQVRDPNKPQLISMSAVVRELMKRESEKS